MNELARARVPQPNADTPRAKKIVLDEFAQDDGVSRYVRREANGGGDSGTQPLGARFSLARRARNVKRGSEMGRIMGYVLSSSAVSRQKYARWP